MKTSFFIAAFCLFSLSIFLGWKKLEKHNNNNLSITVSNNVNNYKYTASFDESLTGKVQDYLNENFKPDGFFKSTNDDTTVAFTLADKTNFYINESRGEIMIELNKRKNSTASYLRIKKICSGISELLKEK